MIKRVKIIGQIESAADLFLGRVREITVNTTKNALRVHDGATIGGFEQARADVSNVPAAGVVDGKMTVAQAGDLSASKASIDAHVGSTTGHPIATPSLPGFESAADKTKLDGIEASADVNPTPAEILADLLTVDGDGSGLDADLLAGLTETIAASINTIMRRDAAGRSKVATPNVAADIATKGYVDSEIIAKQPIEAGSIALWQQTAAPTGWTKLTTHDNKALRIVSGAASSGGGVPFGTLFGTGKITGSHVLVIAEIPAHTHFNEKSGEGTTGAGNKFPGNIAGATGSIGGNGGHTHTMTDLNLQFVDIILARKD